MIVGFLADIHEDITSLDLALEILAQHKCEKTFCLGDIVGFTLPFHQYIQSRDAEACITQIRGQCSGAVAGNHDLYAVRRIPEFRAGFKYADNWYDLEYSARAKRARNKIWLYEDNEIPSDLGPDSSEYLHHLKEVEVLKLEGLSCLISHFCYPDLSGSAIYFPSQAFHLRKHFQFIREHDCQIGISGHGHPEGCLVVDEDTFTLHPFGRIPLTEEPQWIVAPCVARTSRANGCMVLDTEKRTITVVPLKGALKGRQ
jgi:predicted phosphodiesterase